MIGSAHGLESAGQNRARTHNFRGYAEWKGRLVAQCAAIVWCRGLEAPCTVVPQPTRDNQSKQPEKRETDPISYEN